MNVRDAAEGQRVLQEPGRARLPQVAAREQQPQLAQGGGQAGEGPGLLDDPNKTDPTQGVFFASLGATTATPINNSTDTRAVAILNEGGGNTLYVSRDFNPPGSGGQNFSNVSTLTGPTGGLPTSSTGLVTTHIVPRASPFSSGGNNGSIDLTAGTANGINNSRIGKFVYVSPEQYFFASPTVLYVTDSGQPKNGNANAAALGEGGLQKWVLTSGVWTLDYDLYNGLDLVNNANANSATPTAPGVTGLFGLTGEVIGDEVELFATSYGLNELSPSRVENRRSSVTSQCPRFAADTDAVRIIRRALGRFYDTFRSGDADSANEQIRSGQGQSRAC